MLKTGSKLQLFLFRFGKIISPELPDAARLNYMACFPLVVAVHQLHAEEGGDRERGGE
jgi:hypothetical protein